MAIPDQLHESSHLAVPLNSSALVFAPGGTLLLILLTSLRCMAQDTQPIHYVVDLREPESHLVQIIMDVPGAMPGTEIQIPAWNDLYQIRDFARNV